MNIIQIQNRVQELPNTPQTMQYLNAALNGQVQTVPPYIAAAELKRRESEGMMDQLAKGAAQGPQPTVKDQLEQKMGIMALMGQAQPPQRPQIPQPAPREPQTEAQGIDNLPVKDEMFGMASGGIVAFSGGGDIDPKLAEEVERRARLYAAARRAGRGPAGQIAGAGIRGASVAGIPVALAMGLTSAMEDMRAQGYPVDPMGEFGTGAATPEQAEFDEARRQRILQSKAQQRSEDTRLNAMVEGRSASPTGRAYTRGSPEQADQIRQAIPAMQAAARRDAAPMDTGTRKTPTPKPAPKPAAAAAPAVVPGISLADLAPGAPARTLADALADDPAYKKMQAAMNAPNPYTGPGETQSEYINRIRQGILSQIPGGKMPWETSEARLQEIEGRRKREDAEYEARAKSPQRRFEDFLTFASNVGQGTFGQGSSQGVRALQQLERGREAESDRRKALRDEQSMKLMEIRALNDQAAVAFATGNVKEYERLKAEERKLRNEYDLKQAEIAKGITEVGATTRKAEREIGAGEAKVAEETRRAREALTEGSRQKDLDRQNALRVAQIQAASRAEGRGQMTPAQQAKLRADAIKAVDAYLEKAPFKERQAAKDPAVKEELIRKRMETIFRTEQGYTSGSPSPGTSAGGAPEGWGKSTVVKP